MNRADGTSARRTGIRSRLVITVCPREPGVVRLPLRAGGPARRLDAPAILRHLERLVAERGLEGRVRLQEGCAGGCTGAGPNVSVTIYPGLRTGQRPDQVAIGWKTYVYSIGGLNSLAAILDDNLR
jgi:hypothetical protein